MPVPVNSGRTWEPLPSSEPIRDVARSDFLHLRDADHPDYIVLFKRPGDDAPPGERYAIGMDRVAYVLGEALGLPVAPVHLESFAGNPGAMLQNIVNGVSWYWFEKLQLTSEELVNASHVPTFVAFDVWLANIDRTKKNLWLQPVPPSTVHTEARRWKLWLIDHGHCALWPPGKFSLTKEAPAADVELSRYQGRVESIIVNEMPGGYKSQWVDAGRAIKERALTSIGAIEDDQIADAVLEIPDIYFSERERELTIRFLKGRRDRLPRLCP